jgi:hypothetical protein
VTDDDASKKRKRKRHVSSHVAVKLVGAASL